MRAPRWSLRRFISGFVVQEFGSKLPPAAAAQRATGQCAATARFILRRSKFVGHPQDHLLIYVPMISGLLILGVLWHAIQTFPGFLETVGYLFGMLAAAFTLESFWQSDTE